jgi:hypothetical protein
MCCERPVARPPAQGRKASREEILEMIKPTQAKPQQLKTHRGIPNFLEMHYNYIGHTPGSSEEKYKAISDVGVRIGAESYADYFKRHAEPLVAYQKRVATYRNDDGTTRSFDCIHVATGTIQPNIISAGWTKSGPAYGYQDDPDDTEYQNYKRAAVPDYAQMMSKKDYEIYTGTPRGPLFIPQGPKPRYEGYEHDAELASLNIASSLFAISSISILILNMMGG